MNNIEVKKRDWVYKAAIIFLIVMVILTLFSNTILNRSLPEVAAQYTQSGTINARIRGSGTVTANEVYEVITSQAHTVSEVRARLGDEVETGDVLIVLSQSGSTELEETKEALRVAELELEKFLIDSPHSNYASEQRAIQSARESLEQAEERRDLVREQYNAAESTLSKAIEEREAIAFNETAYNSAVSAISGGEAVVENAAAAEAIAQRNLGTYDDINGYDGPLGMNPPPPYGAGDKERDKLVDELNAAKQAHTDAQNALEQLKIDRNITWLEAEREKWDAANAKVESAYNNVLSLRDSLTSANSSVSNAEQSLAAANDALKEAQRQGGVTNSLFDIELREKNRVIEELREKAEQLETDGNISEITAAVSGKITQVNITAGQQTIPESPLLVIEVVDRGYSLSVPVTADQSSRVRVGDSAEVDRGWWSWGNPLTGVLTAIRPDPQNPATGRLLVFSISGDDIESNSQLNITIAQRSENYSIVVPNSAVRSDTNGDFVLIVETKSSPLRNRYIATRVDVTVLATDDINSAISGGGLGGWDFVITTSTRPIEPGMQVRLADNP